MAMLTRNYPFMLPMLVSCIACAVLTGCGDSGVSREELQKLTSERDHALEATTSLKATYEGQLADQQAALDEKEAALNEADRLLSSTLTNFETAKLRIADLERERDEARSQDFSDIVRLRDGQEIRCKVLDLQGSVAQVRMPDGNIRKARLSDVDRILLRVASGIEATPVATVPVMVEEPEETPTGDPNATLALSPFWNIPQPASTRATEALNRVFQGHGTPELDLSARPGAGLYRSVTYLMPLENALKELGLETTQRAEVTTPGLPRSSFFAYEYTGQFEAKFNRMLLVTDSDAQVVAVQLVEDNPSGRWIDRNLNADYSEYFDEAWNLFNVIENHSKSRSSGLIGVQVEQLSEDVVRLDCEFLSSQRSPKECTRLYIAQPVVDLILYLIKEKY